MSIKINNMKDSVVIARVNINESEIKCSFVNFCKMTGLS